MSSLTRALAQRFQQFSMNPTLVFAAIALILLFFFSNLALRQIHASQERIIREHLQSSLGSFSELITIWQQQNIAAIQMLANSARGKYLLQKILREQGENPATRLALREWLYPVLIVMGFDGYSVINHQRIILAASTESYRKQPVLLPETKEVLDKALLNQPAISRPVAAVRPIDGPRGQQPAGTLMQNMCVTLPVDNAEPGYFCLRFNTHTSFFPIFLKGWTGNSGDIYAIDQQGRFITPARFGSRSQPLLTLEQQRAARIGTPVSIPADDHGQAPLTDMVEFLIEQGDELVDVNYRDYRGVIVAGAGRWIPEMELGIIVEQDLDEAMAPYIASRNIIASLTAGAMLLILILTFSALANRRRLSMREGRFRSLLDNLPTPVHMLSMEHHLVVANPAFCNLLGLHKDDMIGRKLGELPVPRWLRPLIADESLCDPETCRRDEIVALKTPAGEPRYFRVVGFPVVYSRKLKPQAVASVWIDYTERVTASEQMEAINQHLEELVDERTRELVIAKDLALAASQSKAEFLANMSHEIRTPLNAIIGLAHVALGQFARGSTSADLQKNYLEKIRGSGEHLLDIINDILNFSRMEAGKLELDRSEFSIDQLIDKALDLIWEKAAAKGLELTVEIDPRIPKLLIGDPLRLGQIIINFCANAVKFTDAGSVSVVVTQVRDWEARVELLFEVKDTGIGIAPEKIAQLFQPFKQVDASSARRFEGTGLGLSICKNLAELMRGHIDVKTTLGRGSNFSFRVQLEKNIAPPALPPAPVLNETASSNRFEPLHGSVLVVEDNLLNQEIIESLLDSMGVKARCVDSGPAAILAVNHDAFDLILMDIQLPGMDGVEATQHIRKITAGRNIPIIAITANALPGDKENYLSAGLDDYLSKPIDPAKLYRTLQQWITSSRVPEKSSSSPGYLDVLQHRGVETGRALNHLIGNEVLYKRLLERFARERAAFPLQLAELLQKDPPAALNQVHALKSLAASLGMVQLESIAARVEEQLREEKNDPHWIEKLSTELNAMVELIKQALDLSDEP